MEDETIINNDNVISVPKIGVSPIPAGCFIVQYAGSDRYVASVKDPTKFSMAYMLSYNSGSSWETH